MQAKNRCAIIVMLCCAVRWLGPAQGLVLSDVMARMGRDQLQDANATEVHRSSESSRLTFEYVIELNRLINRLCSIPAADGPLSASKKAYSTEEEWKKTEQRLEQLVQQSIKEDDHSNDTSTMEHLAAASKAFRKHKKDFEGLLSSNDSRLRAVPLALAVNFAVEDLKDISIDLLHHLERGNDSVAIRAISSGTTVSSFLAYFRRKIDDTKKAFVTQANLTLRRIKTRLAEIHTTQELGRYVEFLTARFSLLTTTIMAGLEQAYTAVSTSLTNYGNDADTTLATGLAALLTGAIDPTTHPSVYLERCLTRFVYNYYEQSRAVGKLLYCVQTEPDTLDSLVAIAVPFLERAAISDSSVTQLNFICSSPDSPDCQTMFLMDLINTDTRELRYMKFEELIGAELTLLAERVEVCTSAVPSVMLQFTTDTQAKFTTCLSTGKTA